MIDVGLWASTPFGDKTAAHDYFGMEANFHRELARRVYALTGVTYRTSPLGDGGGADWMEIHQREVAAAAAALGIATPVDLSQYQLSDPVDHASYFFLCAQEHQRLMRAAGII